MTSNPAFPDSPSSTQIITDFFEAPVNYAENYGQQLRGWIVPPADGNYTFWIASDDGGELWLSTDSNPANQVLLAYVSTWTDFRAWTATPEQQSVPVPLIGGQQYFIRALMKEGCCGDHLSVRWADGNGLDEAPILGTHLIPWGTVVGPPQFLETPKSVGVLRGGTATFRAVSGNLNPTTLQWRRNGIPIPGETGTDLVISNVSLSDDGDEFDCLASNSFGDLPSPAARLSVTWTDALWREFYASIPGYTIAELLSAPSFPDNPTSAGLLSGAFEAPVDIADSYGQRVQGWIVPPATGNYRFWIASDDNSELWLSTDDTPANARVVAAVFSWTSSREWTRLPEQDSANFLAEPIVLNAGQRYFVRALQKEGGGGDNLAVRWLRPDGVDEGPIPGVYLLPWGTGFGGPVIAQPPQATSVVEGRRAEFTVSLSNPDTTDYQWYLDDAPVPGAVQNRLVLNQVLLTQNGARIRVQLQNQFGSTSSDEVVLTVTPDTEAPTALGALNFGPQVIEVHFSEGVTSGTAQDVSHYSLAGFNVVAAVLQADGQTVRLTLDVPLSFGVTYSLGITGVNDLAQTPNPIAPGTVVNFIARQWQPVPIGATDLGQTIAQAVGTTYDVTTRGRGIEGTGDEFTLFLSQVTGDFDVQTRVTASSVPDAAAPMGLMVREDLTTGSRFVASLLGSPLRGAWVSTRTGPGNPVQTFGQFPHNGRQSWLRLRRQGNDFVAFASLDGLGWTVLGSQNLDLPATVYFGLAVASRDPAALATVQFQDVRETVSANVVPAPTGIEPIGPSSRFTSLVISEIHYAPPTRVDARNLEFVEIFNAGEVPEDLTGMRLSGDVDFSFAAGTVLPGGGTLVVAKNPTDFAAVFGSGAVLGPWTGSLPNSAGTVRIRNGLNAILLEVNYRADAGWPAAAGGTGHSLTLRRPSYGENDPRAWGASSRVDGTPGEPDSLTPPVGVLISEILCLPAVGQLAFVELFNASTTTMDLSGAVVRQGVNQYVIPASTSLTPGSFLSLTAATLGFTPVATGGLLTLWNPAQTAAWDCVRYEAQETDVALGRLNNAGPALRRLSAPTPGANNAALRVEPVVLSEIMYNPISGNNDDEYVELHNRSGAAVNVGQWRLADAVTFTIPAGTTIPAGGYLVVAKNRTRLLANYPGQLTSVNTVGNFGGNLRNSGERLALQKSVGGNLVTVEEVTYVDGGRWAEDADGGGSSLERVDPRADATSPQAWAASDETAKAPWSTLEFTGPLDLGHDSFTPSGLQIVMQDGGECLVDDLEVLRGADPNRVANGDFSAGDSGWVFLGNHSESFVEAGVGPDASAALHIRSPGRGDTGANRIYTLFATELTPGDTVTLRARVRWLRGNWEELTGRMTVPANLGSPGLPNTRAVANLGPTLSDVMHQPVVPQPGEPILVTARAIDPDGVGSVVLRYHPDGSGALDVPMHDDGLNGDAVAGDGLYSVRLAGVDPGVLIAFRVLAEDAAGSPAASQFPESAEALVRVGELAWYGTMGNYRIWMTQAIFDAWRGGGGLNNTPRPFTLVYGNSRAVYGGTLRDKGSPFHSGVGDFDLSLPNDDRVLGDNGVVLAAPGNQGSDPAKQREQLAFWLSRKLGLPYLHRRFVHVALNGSQQYDIMEDAQEPDGGYVDAWFNNSGAGDLYKIEDWFEFFEGGGFSNVDANLQAFTSGGLLKSARYRWAWRKRNVEFSANDFANLFALITAANAPDATYVTDLSAIADMNNWMRVFVLNRIVGNWDSFGFSRGKNMYAFRRGTEPIRLLPWDIDFVLGSGSNASNDGLWGSNDPVINRMFDNFAFRRLLWCAYREAINGPLLPSQYQVQIDARERALTANGVPHTGTASIATYIDERRDFIAAQLAASDTADFAITTNGGNDFNISGTLAVLTGTAPFGVHRIAVNGNPVTPEWTSYTEWRMTVVLSQTVNLFTLTGLDVSGNPIPSAVDTITITGNGDAPDANSGLIVTEIMYNPLANPTPPGFAGNELEFLELYNAGSRRLDLSGVRFSAGITFLFPDSTPIDPGQFFVLARTGPGFNATYPGASYQGLFTGQLDNGGETLTLVNVVNAPIFSFAYDDVAPWPITPDGTGPSLQRIDLSPTSSNGPENWTAGPPTPGRRLVAVVGTVRAVNDSVVRTANSSLKIAISALLSNDVGTGLSLVSFDATSALGGTLTRSGPWLIYTPPANNLTDSFLYTLTGDGGATATGVVSVTVETPPNAPVMVLSADSVPDGIRIRSLGIPGFPYTVRAADSVDGPWTTIGTVIAGPHGELEFIDPIPPGSPTRFYQWIGP